MRLTVGPLPPAVYWRRRALVLGAALLVLFLVAQACMAVSASPEASGGAPTSAPATSGPPVSPPAASPPPSEPPDGGDEDGVDSDLEDEESGADEPAGSPEELDPDDPEACTDDEIRVVAEASQEELAVGEHAEFTIRIAHDTDRACLRDVGGDHRELRLVRGTGAEHVWSSRDCHPPTGNVVRELSDGVEREHSILFVGRSSSSCDGPAATGDELEPGEYELSARLGSAWSEPITITLTE